MKRPSNDWSLDDLGIYCARQHRRMAAEAWWIGKAMSIARSKCAVGEFGAWQEKYGFSRPMTSRYIRIYEAFDNPDDLEGEGIVDVLESINIPTRNIPAYKKSIAALTELKRQRNTASSIAYEMIKLAVQLYHDVSYAAYCKSNGSEVSESLDWYFGLWRMSFTKVKKLYEFFPEPARWQKGQLSDLYNEMSERQNARVFAHNKTLTKRAARATREIRRVSDNNQRLHAQVHDKDRTIAELKEKVRFLTSVIREKDTEIARLRSQVHHLKTK